MRVYLIGLPASGKSTVGRELAKKLNYKFIDLDFKIVSDNNETIDQMFQKSEDYFRGKETECLASVQNEENSIISCGGGIVERKVNKDFMQGVVVYLEAPLAEIDFRLNRDSTSRPVSKKTNIYDLYERRKDKYDFFMDFKVESKIVSETVKSIMKELPKYEKNFSN